MNNFIFHNPTKILFGDNQIENMAAEIPHGSKILLTYGGGSIKANGAYDRVIKTLKTFTVIEFSGIEPNPTYETLMRAVELARNEEITFIMAVGGGSVVDGSKFIAAAIPFIGDPWTILKDNAPVKEAIPLGCVLTLPATGTEMNDGAVVSRAATQDKLFFGSEYTYPKFSVLEPSLTMSLPPRQIANGVVDAYTHVMEQYLTYPVNAPLQDRFAESILQTLIEVGPKTLTDPHDYNARASMFWCTTMALNGLIACGVPTDWATHRVGHEITALYGLDHAQTLAIILPQVMQHQRQQKREKLLQYAARVWNIVTGDEDTRIDTAIAKTVQFFRQLGVKTSLSEYGIEKNEAIPKIIASLEKHKNFPLGERNDINQPEVQIILENSF